MALADKVENPSVQAGQVTVTPGKEGWYSVEIGRENRRGTWVKRFWIRDAEARELVARLTEILPS